MGKRLTFILGGARSGKSKYAEKLASEESLAVLYVATAQARDDEMRVRIERHKARRTEYWKTLEAHRNVGSAIIDHAGAEDVVLLDCLAVLSGNILCDLPEAPELEAAEEEVNSEIDGLISAYEDSGARWIVVSNEVGLGVVPPYPLGRVYRDVLGKANQRLTQIADEVYFMVSGLPLLLKGAG